MSHGFRQDMPPAGGYEAIKYKRNLPIRGPGGAVIFGVVGAICAFGFWRVGTGNLEKRELKRETAWSRIHLVPLILAEQDRDAYRRQQAALAREKEIMKDVPDWETKGKGGDKETRVQTKFSAVPLARLLETFTLQTSSAGGRATRSGSFKLGAD